MPIDLSEPKRRLRLHRMAYHVRSRQHPRYMLLNGIRPQFQRHRQPSWIIEVCLPQLHDFETGVYIRQLDHGGIVEEEVLG